MDKKPKIYMSRCFGFEKCRYDGEWVIDSFAEKLKKYAEIIHGCPETGIGLGCPREKIRVVRIDGRNELLQPATGLFFTEKMVSFSRDFLKKLEPVDGFYLKGKSPSCGFGNTKLYEGRTEKLLSLEASGFFAAEAVRMFPQLPVITEKEAENMEKRIEFLSKVFASFGGVPEELLD